jgi:hypothetical protein
MGVANLLDRYVLGRDGVHPAWPEGEGPHPEQVQPALFGLPVADLSALVVPPVLRAAPIWKRDGIGRPSYPQPKQRGIIGVTGRGAWWQAHLAREYRY